MQSMSIDQIEAEALRLPPEQRGLLAVSLLESLENLYESPEEMDESAAIHLALERDRQIESGEVATISHDEMMSRLRR